MRRRMTPFGRLLNLVPPGPGGPDPPLLTSEAAMSGRKPRRIPEPVPPQHLPVIDPHAAAVDVGAAVHWVAVPPGADPQPVRRFGAYTTDLIALADWLKACGVTSVALESNGVYWIHLFGLVETSCLRVRIGGCLHVL